MKTEIQIINEAGRLLLDPKNHCTSGVYTEDAKGDAVLPGDPSACKFCVYGAMAHVNDGNLQTVPELYPVRPSEDLVAYITGNTQGMITHQWDTGSVEFRLACAQRMVDYKGLP